MESKDYCDETPYKKSATKAAQELNYGQEVVEKIRKATSEAEIARIMKTARIKNEEGDF